MRSRKPANSSFVTSSMSCGKSLWHLRIFYLVASRKKKCKLDGKGVRDRGSDLEPRSSIKFEHSIWCHWSKCFKLKFSCVASTKNHFSFCQSPVCHSSDIFWLNRTRLVIFLFCRWHIFLSVNASWNIKLVLDLFVDYTVKFVRSSCIQSSKCVWKFPVQCQFKFPCSGFAHQVPTLVCMKSYSVGVHWF